MTNDELISKYDRILREALSECWASLKAGTNMAEVTRLLSIGDVPGALETLRRVEPAIYASVVPTIQDAILESGRYVAEILPAGAVASPVIISLTDPRTAAYVAEYVGTMIKEISDETVEAVRDRVYWSVNAGRPPAATARDLRDVIGLNRVQEKQVRNFRTALEEDPRSALSRELRDRRFDATLERGEPLTKAEIDRMVLRYQENQLTFRTNTIARTESMTAISVGQDQAIQQGIESGAIRTERPDGSQLRAFWIVTRDGRERWEHEVTPGMNKEGVAPGQPFKTPLGPMHFPRDPTGKARNVIRCRCRIRYRWV